MNFAYQITEEDIIQTVLNKFLLDIDYSQAEKIMAKLDLDKVGAMALEGSEMDEQTDIASDEIAKQIKEGNLFEGVVA